MNPILFLDIDGVLVTADSLRKSDQSGINAMPEPRCVEQLNRIIRETGADVVLSSTWKIFHVTALSVNRFLFPKFGVVGHCVGVTPTLHTQAGRLVGAEPRGHEIQSWLDANGNPDRFVILDDANDMEHLLPRLVQCSYFEGLTEELANRAIEMLAGKVAA
jgi:hypothetical protein